MGCIRDQNDPRLEESTKEIYAKEFYGGVLTDKTRNDRDGIFD